jgi:glutathione S-transferase
MWMFAALSSIEPAIVDREAAYFMERDRSWYRERQPLLDDRIRSRLAALAASLGDSEWLERSFTAGDLLTISVLRRLAGSRFLDEFPNLTAYVARGEERPAFKRAFDAQRAVFLASQTDGRSGT